MTYFVSIVSSLLVTISVINVFVLVSVYFFLKNES